MLFEYYDLDLNPVFVSALFGGLLGLGFGAAAQISRFCLRRGVVGRGAERSAALGTWLTALLVTLLATQVLAARGLVDLSGHRFGSSDIPVLAILAGGLLFGAGMVLTRGCVSRLTVLSATGNLRAWTVLAVFAIVAHASMKGVLAPLRAAVTSMTVDAGGFALAAGLPGGAAFWTAALAVPLAALIWRSDARRRDVALAAAIGLLATAGWFGTGVLLYDEFDPIPLESLSFTAPWAETLFWTVASTSIPAGFGTGLIGGVLVGAFLSAAARRELRLQSFETSGQTLRYLAGGALMGFGGVLAGGCTVGAGLSGVAGLSLAAVLALGSIIAGARVADRLLDRVPPAGAVIPAE